MTFPAGMADVEIFTDGACRGNPGPGGWAAIVRSRGREKELSGGEAATTNNRMELKAAIEGLNALTRSATISPSCHRPAHADIQSLRALWRLWTAHRRPDLEPIFLTAAYGLRAS